MPRVAGVRSDDVYLVAALDVKNCSWFDLLLCTNHTHIRRDYWHNDKSLEARLPLYRCCCSAAVGFLCG